MLNETQRSLLSILQDETRCKILEELSEQPCPPDRLVEVTGVSRTAVEKHLKLLLFHNLIERRAQSFPRLRYIYSITYEGEILLSGISNVTDIFIESSLSKWEEELTQIEQGFVYGVIQKDEYDKLKKDYQAKISGFKKGIPNDN